MSDMSGQQPWVEDGGIGPQGESGLAEQQAPVASGPQARTVPETRSQAALAAGRSGIEPAAPALPEMVAAHRLVMRANLCAVRGTVVRAVAVFGPHLPEQSLDDLEIVLSEVLNNVVEHAYAGLGEGSVDLALGCQGGDAMVTVSDRGRPMPAQSLAAAHAPDLTQPVAALPEGGFGWSLIRSLARDIQYSRIDGVNRLSFRVPRNR